MNKINVTGFFKRIGAGMKEHSPEILTAIGVTGMITTTVLAVKATPKALKLIEEKKEELNLEPEDNLTPVETVKAAWKPYVPAVVTGVVSTACLIGANSVHAKRNAALATAYQISTTALNEYREKVVETIGEKKERAIHDKVAEKRVTNNPPSNNKIYDAGNIGNTLCYDMHSGRYFKSDLDRIRRTINDLNYRMTTGYEMSISLNEYYDGVGLERIVVGDSLGWRADRGLIEIHPGAILTENDVPCVTIEFLNPPEYGFNKLYG